MGPLSSIDACCSDDASPPKRRLARLGLVLALAPLLAGCAAAVALPLVAGGALYVRDKIRVRAATPNPAVTVGDAEDRDDDDDEDEKDAEAEAAGVVLTPLTELPPPTQAQIDEAAKWAPFVDYALAQANDEEQRASALIWPD